MNTNSKIIHRFIKFLLITTLVSACGVESSSSIPPTEIPILLTSTPTAENPGLQTANFDGVIIPSTLEGLPVFFGIGSVLNNQNEALQIIAAGTSDFYIREYFETAKFYFEIRENSLSPSPNVSPIQIVDFSLSEALNADEANLLIQIGLPPSTREKYPRGVLFVEIDPSVGQNQQHIYLPTDPATNEVKVEIRSRQGAADGKLYLQNVGLLDTKMTTAPDTPEVISGAGEGVFDFVVTGLDTGENIYRLSSTWSYDYEANPPPIETTVEIPPTESIDADSIMTKMLDSYKSLASYLDSGTTTITFFDGSGTTVTDIVTKSFSTAFLRSSGQFRFQYTEENDEENNYIIWFDGYATQSWWGIQPGVENEESLYSALSDAWGASNSTSFDIPIMLIEPDLQVSDTGFGYLLPLTLLGDAPCNSTVCFELQGQSSRDITRSDGTVVHVDSTVYLWIEKETYLIVKIERFSQYDTFRTEEVTLYNSTVNQEIPPDLFEPRLP